MAGKIIVVRSELDEDVPKAVTTAYADLAATSPKVIKNARHALRGREREVFKGILVDWAKQL